ncbi:MAG: RHS repeat-associated core domain-containing protein [Vicingaceae bacterium]
MAFAPTGGVQPGRNGVSSADYDHGYQGQFTENDEETGWDAFELRMYDGRMARWMSDDPYRQYHSPYLAMGNNPISGVDPDGGWSWLGAGIGAVAGGVSGGLISQSNGGSFAKGAAGGALLGFAAGGVIGQMATNIDKGQELFREILAKNSLPHLYGKRPTSAWGIIPDRAKYYLSTAGKFVASNASYITSYSRGAFYIYNNGRTSARVKVFADGDEIYSGTVQAKSSNGRYIEYGENFSDWLKQKRDNELEGTNITIEFSNPRGGTISSNIYLVESGGIQTRRPVSPTYARKRFRFGKFTPVDGIW